LGARVIKTAIATVIAVYLATFLGLSFPYAAGLLAILGVDVTRRRSLKTASVRIISTFLGLLAAMLLFWVFGFHIWVLGLYILVVFPILNKINFSHGIVTTSVVVIVHVFSSKQLGLDLIINELLLLLVGLGTATIINFVYMPNPDKAFNESRREIEALFSRIFLEISHHLQDSSHIWSGSEVLTVHKEIAKGIELSKNAEENIVFGWDFNWLNYFQMRQLQMESIQRMMLLVAQVYQTLPHGKITAALFEKLSEDVKQEFYTGHVEGHLTDLEQQFKKMPLPASREEFEVRSALLQLILELKHFLLIAKREQQNFVPNS
jgi:uncharacterized membrane protein YgaE (UPF0421/DUF939 family)